jgi:hypothetical protein
MKEPMSYRAAVDAYKAGAEPLRVFQKPVKDFYRFDRNSWLLFGREHVLVAIVPNNGAPPIFHHDLTRMLMQRVSDSV